MAVIDRFKEKSSRNGSGKKKNKKSRTLRQHIKRALWMRGYWTTALLLLGLAWRVQVELAEIRSLPPVPHTTQDLIVRYLFSVGLTYVVMFVTQALLVMTVARKAWLSIPAVALSIFFGGLFGERFERFSNFSEAKRANLRAWDPHRLPAQQKSNTR
jgi:hypothetical protein